MAASLTRLDGGPTSDWSDGMMREVALDPSDAKSPKVLVSKIHGRFYATSSKCTHYGAPLIKGVLSSEGCVTCPWHGAKFSVCKEGDIEDAPALNRLQPFSVVLENGHVFVEVDKEVVKKTEYGRPPQKCQGLANNTAEPGVVVIGGGSGGHFFVEEIRRLDYNGSVTLISKEPYLPIDRTKLSKALITDPKKISLRDEAFYKESNINVKLSTSVESVDLSQQTVKLSDGSALPYSKLIVSTGATPRNLPIEGANLKGIHTLRTISDAQDIEALISPSGHGSRKKLALIGSSFICMELAVFASKKEHLEIHVIGMDKVPLGNILGEQIGKSLRKFYEKSGIQFHLEAGIEKFVASESDSSSVGGVALKGGEVIKCDGVVVGIGAKPNTELLGCSGIQLEKDGSVVVDQYLRITDPKAQNKVYAIGDIAKYPDILTDSGLTRIEHWNVAGNHARAAAKNVVNEQKSAGLVPFVKPAIFWSAQGQQLRYVGSGKASQWKDVIVEGTPDELKFIAYYCKDDEIVAVATMQKDPVMVHAAELMAHQKLPSVSDIRKGVNLLQLKI